MLLIAGLMIGSLGLAALSEQRDASREIAVFVVMMFATFGMPALLAFGIAIRRAQWNRRITRAERSAYSG
ncbi:hypothetical protein [Nocardia sp. NPDC050710]|uniref:hypothetical protein n=1 Tax=Nocardia sp. NPDC050710 TaxID=3157220 RepID=UPI0033E91954